MLYNIVICFAVYWFSNLILWYPWSINEKLGQFLMLSINPLLWGYASYSCLIRYPKSKLINAVVLNSLIFIIEAVASDLVFFGIIRNAMNKLKHVTTLYAWGFVISLPFIVYLFFEKTIIRQKREIKIADFWKPVFIGLISFIAITYIILLHFKFE